MLQTCGHTDAQYPRGNSVHLSVCLYLYFVKTVVHFIEFFQLLTVCPSV